MMTEQNNPVASYTADLMSCQDEAYRAGVGKLRIQWVLLELNVERMLARLKGDRDVAPGTDRIMPSVDSIEHLLPTSDLSRTDQKKIRALMSQVRTLVPARNRVEDGLWSASAEAAAQSLQAPSSVEDIEQLKLAIVDVCQWLRPYVGSSKEAKDAE
jgi:hypothetical protein